MNYPFVKFIHVFFAAAIFAGYVLRLVWMISDNPRPPQGWIRAIPWVADSILLATGIWMLFKIAHLPGVEVWMIGKILLVIVFGCLTVVTLYFIKSQPLRVLTWIGALVIYLQMVVISIIKDPTGIFALTRWIW